MKPKNNTTIAQHASKSKFQIYVAQKYRTWFHSEDGNLTHIV